MVEKGTPPLGLEPSIHPDARVVASELGIYTEVGARTAVVETQMGDYSYVVQDSQIIYTQVGKFANIASHTRINPGNHPQWRASQHHFMYRASSYGLGEDEAEFFDWRRNQPVTLGHDCWIGHGVVIMPGVSVGIGAIIGSGAIVTKDVPDYAIAVGNPAKVIKMRHPEDLAQQLKQLAWWDWSHDQLKQALPDFRALSAQDFADKYQDYGW